MASSADDEEKKKNNNNNNNNNNKMEGDADDSEAVRRALHADVEVDVIVDASLREFERLADQLVQYERSHERIKDKRSTLEVSLFAPPPEDACDVCHTRAARAAMKQFEENVECLRLFGKHCMAAIVDRVVRWRRTKLAIAQNEAAQLERTTGSSSTKACESVRLFLEAYSVAVDLVLTRVLDRILEKFDGKNVPDAQCVAIQGMALAVFQEEFSLDRAWWERIFKGTPNTNVYHYKRHLLVEQWRDVIHRLSHYRAEDITSSYLRHVKGRPTGEAVGAIKGLKRLKLRINDEAAVRHTVHVVAQLRAAFSKRNWFAATIGQHDPRKEAIAVTLTSMLTPLHAEEERTKDVNLTTWFIELEKLFEVARMWAARRREHWRTGAPLLMAITCASDRENHLMHFKTVLEFLLTIHDDPSHRVLALVCVQQLVEVYLRSYAERGETTHHNLAMVRDRIFLPLGPEPLPADVQDTLVAIILTIAKYDPEFAIRDIIVGLAQRAGERDELLSDVALVALRSLTAVMRRPDHSGLGRPPISASAAGNAESGTRTLFKCHAKRKHRRDYSLLHPRPADVLRGVLDSVHAEAHRVVQRYTEALSLFLSKTLSHCNKTVGHFKVTSALTLGPAQSAGVAALRLTLLAIPVVYPADMQDTQLVEILCGCCLHVDEGIRNAAFFVMEFMATKTHIRAVLVNEMAAFVDTLTRESPNHGVIIANSLVQTNRLVEIWTQSLLARTEQKKKDDKDRLRLKVYHDLCIQDVEATALLGLCHEDPQVRLASLDLLERLRGLSRAAKALSDRVRTREHLEVKDDKDEQEDKKNVDDADIVLAIHADNGHEQKKNNDGSHSKNNEKRALLMDLLESVQNRLAREEAERNQRVHSFVPDDECDEGAFDAPRQHGSNGEEDSDASDDDDDDDKDNMPFRAVSRQLSLQPVGKSPTTTTSTSNKTGNKTDNRQSIEVKLPSGGVMVFQSPAPEPPPAASSVSPHANRSSRPDDQEALERVQRAFDEQFEREERKTRDPAREARRAGEQRRWQESQSRARFFTSRRIKVPEASAQTELKALRAVAAQACSEGQEQWTVVLAEIIRAAMDAVPVWETLSSAHGKGVTMLEPLLQNINRAIARQEAERQRLSKGCMPLYAKLCRVHVRGLQLDAMPDGVLTRYTNYTVLATITAETQAHRVAVPDALDRDHAVTRSAFEGGHSFSDQFIKLLGVEAPSVRRLAVTALGNVHHRMMLHVLGLCHDLLADIDGGLMVRKRRPPKPNKKFDAYRVDVATIMRLLAEGLTPDVLADYPKAAESFRRFIEATQRFLREPGNEVRWDLLELRVNFCRVVQLLSDLWSPDEATDAESAPGHVQSVVSSPRAIHSKSKDGEAVRRLLEPVLPRDMRRSLFDFLLAWCGYGPSCAAYAQQVLKHQGLLLKQIQRRRSGAAQRSIEATMRYQHDLLRVSALRSMASLMRGECFDEELLMLCQQYRRPNKPHMPLIFVDNAGELLSERSIFAWLHDILRQDEPRLRAISYCALESFIESNTGMMPEYLNRCYCADLKVARRYMIVLGETFLRRGLPLELPALLHLVVFALGDRAEYVRGLALRLVRAVEERFSDQLSSAQPPLPVVLGSLLPDTFLETQHRLSMRLSKEFGHLANEYMFEMAGRLRMLDDVSMKRQLLRVALPWVSHLHLALHKEHAVHLHDALIPEPPGVRLPEEERRWLYGHLPFVHDEEDVDTDGDDKESRDDGDDKSGPSKLSPSASSFLLSGIPHTHGGKLTQSNQELPRSRHSVISLPEFERSSSLEVLLPHQHASRHHRNISVLTTSSTLYDIAEAVPYEPCSPKGSSSSDDVDEEIEVEAKRHRGNDDDDIDGDETKQDADGGRWAEHRIHNPMLDVLVEMTLLYGGVMPDVIESLWQRLAAAPSRVWPTDARTHFHSFQHALSTSNVSIVVNYLLLGLSSRHSGWDVHGQPLQSRFLDAAKRVTVYMARALPKQTLTKLIEEVGEERHASYPQARLSSANFALTMLVEAAFDVDMLHGEGDSLEQLVELFHVAMLGMEHPVEELRPSARRLMAHLLHSLAFSSHSRDLLHSLSFPAKPASLERTDEDRREQRQFRGVVQTTTELRCRASALIDFLRGEDERADVADPYELRKAPSLPEALAKALVDVIQKLEECGHAVLEAWDMKKANEPATKLDRLFPGIRVLPRSRDHFGTLPRDESGPFQHMTSPHSGPRATRIADHNKRNPVPTVPDAPGEADKFVTVAAVSAHALQQRWADYALQWAAEARGDTFAMLSLRIYRSLHPLVTEPQFEALMSALCACLDAPDAHAPLMTEVLRTMNALIGRRRSALPNTALERMLWASVLLLRSSIEDEAALVEGLRVLGRCLSTLDLSNVDVCRRVSDHRPAHLADDFAGVQPLVLGRLRSSAFAVQLEASRLLGTLNEIKAAELIDPDKKGRFVRNMIGQLPYLCMWAGRAHDGARPAGVEASVHWMRRYFRMQKQEPLAAEMKTYASNGYSSAQSFIARFSKLFLRWLPSRYVSDLLRLLPDMVHPPALLVGEGDATALANLWGPVRPRCRRHQHTRTPSTDVTDMVLLSGSQHQQQEEHQEAATVQLEEYGRPSAAAEAIFRETDADEASAWNHHRFVQYVLRLLQHCVNNSMPYWDRVCEAEGAAAFHAVATRILQVMGRCLPTPYRRPALVVLDLVLKGTGRLEVLQKHAKKARREKEAADRRRDRDRDRERERDREEKGDDDREKKEKKDDDAAVEAPSEVDASRRGSPPPVPPRRKFPMPSAPSAPSLAQQQSAAGEPPIIAPVPMPRPRRRRFSNSSVVSRRRGEAEPVDPMPPPQIVYSSQHRPSFVSPPVFTHVGYSDTGSSSGESGLGRVQIRHGGGDASSSSSSSEESDWDDIEEDELRAALNRSRRRKLKIPTIDENHAVNVSVNVNSPAIKHEHHGRKRHSPRPHWNGDDDDDDSDVEREHGNTDALLRELMQQQQQGLRRRRSPARRHHTVSFKPTTTTTTTRRRRSPTKHAKARKRIGRSSTLKSLIEAGDDMF